MVMLSMQGCIPDSRYMLRSDSVSASCVLEEYYKTMKLPDGTEINGEDLRIRLHWLMLLRAGETCQGVMP